MENQAGAAPEKKKRPRIQRPVARPTQQTFSQTVVTTPYSRQNMAKTKPVDEISFMEGLLKDAEAVCRKSPAAVKALLVKIAPKSEKDRLKNLSFLIKYILFSKSLSRRRAEHPKKPAEPIPQGSAGFFSMLLRSAALLHFGRQPEPDQGTLAVLRSLYASSRAAQA